MVVAVFFYIFYSSPLSCTFMMCIIINRISWNIALDGKPYFRTSALLSQGGNPLRTTFLDSYDQTPSLHSLMRTSTTVFNRPRTTKRPQTGPPTQYILLVSSLHVSINKLEQIKIKIGNSFKLRLVHYTAGHEFSIC